MSKTYDVHGQKKGNPTEDVWSVISTFEQILEAMPQDRLALEALAQAYTEVGDHARATQYQIRLADALMSAGELSAAQAMLPQLEAAAKLEPLAGALAKRIREAVRSGFSPTQSDTLASEATDSSSGRDEESRQMNVAEELTCAWNLFQAGELTQEEYASVVHDLTELSVQQSRGTVSTLHILEGRKFRNLEKIVATMVRDCGTPFISLGNFELRHDVAVILPFDFVMRRGALVFDLLGQDALVAVMNPYDRKLRERVAEMAGRRCHFYVTLPSEFDQAVEKLRTLLAAEDAAAKVS